MSQLGDIVCLDTKEIGWQDREIVYEILLWADPITNRLFEPILPMFFRPYVGLYVGPSGLSLKSQIQVNSSKFKLIKENVWLFATVGWVTAVLRRL